MNRLANPLRAALLCACGTLLLATTMVQAGQSRQESRSAAGFVSERAPDARRDPLRPAPAQSTEIAPRQSKSGTLSSVVVRNIVCCLFRVYSADTQLFDDFDADGYYTYLRVDFDVDTDFSSADIYANLYLARSYEPWELFFESEVFTVFGSSPDDNYEVETEFVSGYPPGDYDVLIEIYDASSGDLVASYGPADSPSLSYLPIEDIDFDSEIGSEIFASGSSGSLVSLAVLLLTLLIRHRVRHLRP